MNKRNSAIFAVFLGIAIIGFSIVIGRAVFKSGDNGELEKKLSQSSLQSNSSTTASATNVAGAQTANNQTPVASASTPTQTAPSVPQDSTSEEKADTKTDEEDKKTYENKDMGVSFQYPSEYNISQNGSQLVAEKEGKIQWRLKVYENKNKKDIKGWFDGYFDDDNNADCVLSESGTLKFGSLTTKILKADLTDKKCDDGGYFSLNDKETKVVRITLGKASETEANKILSTAKFLE